jgi:uncharacterized membrane protein
MKPDDTTSSTAETIERAPAEIRRRSLVKAISWRALGTLDTMVISWIITGKLVIAVSIGSVEVVTKCILYYFHERAWMRVRWGKK